jgi:uncharacterized cupredoxin-like copper-binding protein
MRYRLERSLPVLAVAFALAAVVSGCGGSSGLGSADTTLVSVREQDFSIDVSPRTIPAGKVVFQAANRGPDAHELIVVRAQTRALPLRSDGMTVDEEELRHATVGALEPGEPGSVRDLEVRLSPGRYVLLCNMAGHYMGGMHAVLTVR